MSSAVTSSCSAFALIENSEPTKAITRKTVRFSHPALPSPRGLGSRKTAPNLSGSSKQATFQRSSRNRIAGRRHEDSSPLWCFSLSRDVVGLPYDRQPSLLVSQRELLDAARWTTGGRLIQKVSATNLPPTMVRTAHLNAVFKT